MKLFLVGAVVLIALLADSAIARPYPMPSPRPASDREALLQYLENIVKECKCTECVHLYFNVTSGL